MCDTRYQPGGPVSAAALQSGQSATISFTVTPPSTSGAYQFSVLAYDTAHAMTNATIYITVGTLPPTVTSLSPVSGTTAGGNPVTIAGTHLTGTIGVDFGTKPATNITVVNDTTITATSPAGTGAVDVTVTTPDGTSAIDNLKDRFTYVAPPMAGPAVTTEPATNMTSTDATLNGTNGKSDAIGHSFWVSLSSPIDTSSFTIPSGVYSSPDLGNVSVGTPFSYALSNITANGIPANLPAITPDTTYHYVAWSNVSGTWHPGATETFKTSAVPVVLSSAKDITVFGFGLTGETDMITGTDIVVTVPNGTNITALTPMITTSADATVAPVSGTPENFSNPVNYVVTAENGTTRTYAVTLKTAAPSGIDKVAPVIILSGASNIDLAINNPFADPGAAATDAVDGTDVVTVSGTVNTAVAGTYTLTYNATEA